jgi:hypothetical protein
MNAFTQLLILFAALVSLMSHVTVSAMPISVVPCATQPARLQGGRIQRDVGGYIVHDGRPEYVKAITPIATPYPTATPTLAPVDDQAENEAATDETDGPFSKMHPAAVIALFTFTPFAACILLYPVFRWLRKRREAAHITKKEASVRKGVTSPGTPTSPYLNNPRLAPLPTYPQMVYVPPTAKDGTRPIFGHIRSPSGNHIFGVTDRWVIAEGAEESVEFNRSTESLLVREV